MPLAPTPPEDEWNKQTNTMRSELDNPGVNPSASISPKAEGLSRNHEAIPRRISLTYEDKIVLETLSQRLS